MRKFTGEKYPDHKETDIKDIAVLIRAELKAIPGLKVSVKIERYSMGQSMHICIKETGFKICPEAYIKYAKDGYPQIMADNRPERYTPEAVALKDKIEAIANQYNYDNSDSQTDYFDVNYYLYVNYDSDLIDKEIIQ